MCYWLLTGSVKVVSWTTAHQVIHTYSEDPDTKGRIGRFDEELEKRLDDIKFVDDVGDDFYIDDLDEANEAALGDGVNTPSDEAYVDIMAEDRIE